MTEHSQDWIEGFLVVGNQPVLDLLNTRLVVGDEEQETLVDPGALVRWLHVSGLVVAPALKSRLEGWSKEAEAWTFLNELVAFRESLRNTVFRLEEGKLPSGPFLADLNARLFSHPFRTAVVTKRGSIEGVQAEGASVADTLWAAVLHETLNLLIGTDSKRVRKCESCVVHFQDISKKNSRRWCSMRLCGNRIKVRAYQEREREARKRNFNRERAVP